MRRLQNSPKVVLGIGIAVAIGLTIFTTGPHGGEATAQALNPSGVPPAPTLSGNLPLLVPAPPTGLTPEQSRPWFDSFSWQEFIALNWPSVPNKRGIPDQPNDPTVFQNAFKPNAQGNYPPVVWGTWKQAYELFEQGSERPTPWNSFKAVLPCNNPAKTPPLTFLDDTPNDINESFSFPLIDQQDQYTRYEIRMNEPEYEFIRGQDNLPSSWLYIQPNLLRAEPITFPMSTETKLGAMEVKAAWKPITAGDDMGRYYVVNALVLDPISNKASEQRMGLVGFHIAHKTSPFGEWVWSTFEHVDNVQVGPNAPAGTKPSYNNGTATPASPNGYDVATSSYPPMLAPENRVAVQVTRVNPIPTTPPRTSTADLNTAFQKVVAGTVWENYELIATQWPTLPSSFKVGGAYPQDCGMPFPLDGVANTTIETYDQVTAPGTGNSCMQCHYLTSPTDFSWVLALRAHQPVAAADQASFLAKRHSANRTLEALSAIGLADSAKASAARKAIETLKARRTKIRQR